ncbi:hypothetical protein [Streptosporangium sp. 'caverna']|uniref:hypothetical protein n=1 Tax=Streptosporangium sp. 'caverna' TaxID=2202249 RepID=UPI0013A6DD69|nr:hypothetical protein [Streptosporangium sp. 'caverna']
MGFPGEPPRRQPYNQPDASPPAQGEHWFDASPHNRAPEGARAAQGAWPPPSQPQQPPSPPRQQQPPPQRQERPRQERWSPYDEGPRSRRPIYIAVGALAVLIAGGIGLAMLANSDSPAATATASPPAADSNAPAPNTPDDKFGFATARKTDPLLLTLNEVFKNKKVKIGGQSYLMTTRRADKKCGDAVVGSKLQKALTGGKCNQLLRASFRDASGKIIGTVGVANLSTSTGAANVVSAGTGKEREEYIKPLPGKDTVTKFLGTGEAFVGEWRHGHYVVMVWFQYKDGHLPKKTEVKKLNQAAFGAADATVTPALEGRSLTGKRP